MGIFYKILAGVMVTVVLCVFLAKNNKDYATMIVLAASCIIIISAISYLQPIIDFVMRIKRKADLDSDALNIILQAVGVGVLTEIIGMICCDAGFAALDKVIKFVSSVVVLWLSIPLFEVLLELLETILGNI